MCGNSNVLTLCYHFDEDNINIVCRNKCLADNPHLREQDKFWTAVVTEESFDQIFASRVGNGTPLNEQEIFDLEQNLSQGLIKNPYEIGPTKVKKIKMKYDSVNEYQETFQSLIDLEHEYELFYDQGEYQKELKPVWSPDYSRFSFWIIDEQCHFRPKDEVCVITKEFKVKAVIQSIEGNGKINVVLNGRKVGNGSLDLVTIKGANTDVAFNRMTRGLKMMKKIDEAFRNILLGFDVEMPNKGLHPLEDYSVKGLSRLNSSQNEAVRNALNSMFCLIQGPPGTGKTVTTATIVYHLSKNLNRQSVFKITEAELKSKEEELCSLFDSTCAVQQQIEFTFTLAPNRGTLNQEKRKKERKKEKNRAFSQVY